MVARALNLISVKALLAAAHYTKFMLEKGAVLAERGRAEVHVLSDGTAFWFRYWAEHVRSVA